MSCSALRHRCTDGTLDATRRADKYIMWTRGMVLRNGKSWPTIMPRRGGFRDGQNPTDRPADRRRVSWHVVARTKRHFFDLTEARYQGREALDKIEETRGNAAAQQQTREAKTGARTAQSAARRAWPDSAAQNQASKPESGREAQQHFRNFKIKCGSRKPRWKSRNGARRRSKIREVQQFCAA